MLEEIAGAIPEDSRNAIIIIGSLAVGYHFFANQEEMVVRTKDVDCLLSPRIAAIPAGIAIVERLLAERWSFKNDDRWGSPGNEATPDEDLPAVRLFPAHRSEWFIELLTVPESSADRDKRWVRIVTRYGHFGLCSFGFLSLANVAPIRTAMGIHIARPEMMALANLLEHPVISPDTMSGGFTGRAEIKRSNKDLGRVLTIARLATSRDEDALLDWPDLWREALQDRFPDDWRTLARRAGHGLRALLESDADFEQAWYTCVNGLLVSVPTTLDELRISGQRLLQDAIVPFEIMGQ